MTEFISKLKNSDVPDRPALCSDHLAKQRLAVKDLFHIAGIPTTAGNPCWLETHAIPTVTSSAVLKLLAHGAVLVGKTVTDELAYSLNGQNMHYGTPVNPTTPDRLPGGSTSGSAVAVAANHADLGLGTDTGGSIRVPASYNNLFGLRPTHGRISCDNMVALAPSFDTVGLLTRDLATLTTGYAALFDNDAEPFLSCRQADQREQDEHHVHANKGYATSLTIGIAHNLFALCEHNNELVQLTDLLSSTICQTSTVHQVAPTVAIENITIDTETFHIGDTFRILQGSEIWQEHGVWLETENSSIAPDIRARLDWCKTITLEQVEQAKQQQTNFDDYLEDSLAAFDMVIMPTTPGYAPLLSAPASELADFRNQLLKLTAIAGLSGRPQLHIPFSSVNSINPSLPCGFSLVGKRNQDMQLLTIARTLLDQLNKVSK